MSDSSSSSYSSSVIIKYQLVTSIMVKVRCPIAGCNYESEDQTSEIVVKLLDLHQVQHQQNVSTHNGQANNVPKLNRPHIDHGVTREEWLTFTRRWEAYKRGSCIPESVAGIQLFQCTTEQLGNSLLNADNKLLLKPENEVLNFIEQNAVVKVAIGVLRTELMQLSQQNDEAYRTFATRVRAKAETCDFKFEVHCSCEAAVNADYTEEIIKDVMLAGIGDIEIQREVLGIPDIHKRTVNDIITVIESKEMGRNAASTSSRAVAGVSAFKQQKQLKSQNDFHEQQAKCKSCNKLFKPFRKHPKYGWNSKPYKQCIDCWRAKPKQQNSVEKVSDEETELMVQNSFASFQISALQNKKPHVLEKIILNKKELQKAKISDHPKITFQLSHPTSGHCASVKGIADSGAQSNLWGIKGFKAAGFNVKDLQSVVVKIRAANKNPINILGAFKGIFKGTSPNNKTISCSGTVYVSDTVEGFFLSYETMVDLSILSPKFPTIGEHTADVLNTVNLNHISVKEGDPEHESPACVNNCNCPLRSEVPKPPAALPFAPIEANVDKMRSWLLKQYASSTFNICPHRPLSTMRGPPIEFHVDETAKPRVCHTAAPIPIHWQEKVKEDLDRDEALGVIEKVPYGTPVTWCHRMVITRKHNGEPRRTVDLSPLNKFCTRETFSTESPFKLARRVPRNTYKTVTDAWNGYHSVPLRIEDRHLTTFITPFGRYRYTRAPQGFVSSGDGYNQRFNSIISDFQQKERCVDDTIFYDSNLEDHWWQTISFLSKVGSAGIVLNPSKFQFSLKMVEFAGFRISDTSIEPLPKYLDAIRTFPVPRSITDIKSWFGLTNQVANYAQLRDLLSPFRKFLSPKTKFEWTSELNDVFIKSRDHIV